MSMTGSEFYAYVLNKFIRTDKSDEVYQAITDTIADMRIQFLSEDYKEETYSSGISTIGEYKIALPSDFGHIIGDISITDTGTDDYYNPLVKISKQEYDRLYPDRLLTSSDNMNKSVPEHFCIYGNQIFLGPVPDKTTYRYQFNYTTEGFTEVDADTDPVPFSGKYRNILRNGVLAELHDGLENFEESSYWRQMYQTGISKIAYNDDNNTADNQPIKYCGF